MVDGRLTKTQVTPRPETIWPEVWTSMSKCVQKKAKEQWDTVKPKIQAARQKRTLTTFIPDEVEELRLKEDGNSSGTSAMPCGTRLRIPAAKTPTRQVAVSNVGGC